MFSKISEILANPETAQKIREIASSLSDSSGGNETAADISQPVDGGNEAPSAMASGNGILPLLGHGNEGGHSRDLALLQAIRPYMRQTRAGKIDTAIRAIRMIDMLKALR